MKRAIGGAIIAVVAHPVTAAAIVAQVAVLASRGVVAAAQTAIVTIGLLAGLHVVAPRLMRRLRGAGRAWSAAVMEMWRRRDERRRLSLHEKRLATSISDGMATRALGGGDGR